jgi:hypothetical protein
LYFFKSFSWGDFMRGIDCVHFRCMKTRRWP